MNWIQDHWALLLPLALGAVGIWLMMPGSRSIRPLGGLAGLGALILGFQLAAGGRDVTSILTTVFSAGCLVSAVLMITSRNPVYAALWFAVVTLSVCGLFMMQSAPFLAAASIIVYAGAIIVTFLFVIMLAQQSGHSVYDQTSRQPFFASVAAFTLLGLLLFTLQSASENQLKLVVASNSKQTQPEAAVQVQAMQVPSRSVAQKPSPHQQSRPIEGESIGQLRGLGRSLFTDFLFAVEIGGTLLLIASIGAISLAPRRAQGTL